MMAQLNLKGSSSLSTILMIVILSIPSSRSSPVKRDEPSEASATAFIITSAMNESANPCQDYYEYSCGNWGKLNPRPPGRGTFSYWELIADSIDPKLENILQRADAPIDNEAIRKARKVYQKCADSDAIEGASMDPIKSVLDDNGGWPLLMTPEEWNAKNITWQQVHLNLWKTWVTRSIFDMTVEPDLKDSAHNKINLAQPDMPLSPPELLNTEGNEDLLDAYKAYILNVVQLVDASGADAPGVLRDINDMIDFQKGMAEIQVGASTNEPDEFYYLMSFDELQKLYDTKGGTSPTSQINWLETCRDMFSINPEVTVTGTETLTVPGKAYISELGELLSRTSARTIVNYIMWNSIATLAEHGNQQLRNSLVEFNGKRPGAEEIADRDCTGESQMKCAVSYAFVRENFPPESKQKATEMLNNLLKAMKQHIEHTTWMDEDTRKASAGKMEAIKTFTGYPDDFSAENLDAYYADFTPGDTYFDNEIMRRKFQMKKDLKALGGPTNPNEWPEEPTKTNAFYKPNVNAIYVPAGILQAPLYDPNRPSIVNYAMIGTVLGHEVGHSLDSGGRRYDKDGNLAVWWQQSSIDKYEEKTQCFVNQFSKYIVIDHDGKEPLYVDGNKTLEENTSDTTGIKIAFDAYKMASDYDSTAKIPGLEKFTEEQIFFLGFSNVYCSVDTDDHLRNEVPNDEHSPSKPRIIGTVSNTNEFAKAFNCPPNSPVNPGEKCELF